MSKILNAEEYYRTTTSKRFKTSVAYSTEELLNFAEEYAEYRLGAINMVEVNDPEEVPFLRGIHSIGVPYEKAVLREEDKNFIAKRVKNLGGTTLNTKPLADIAEALAKEMALEAKIDVIDKASTTAIKGLQNELDRLKDRTDDLFAHETEENTKAIKEVATRLDAYFNEHNRTIQDLKRRVAGLEHTNDELLQVVTKHKARENG